MRRVDRTVWPYLTLALAACSAIIDFEPPPDQKDDKDGGPGKMDAGDASNGERDSGSERDTGTDSGRSDGQQPATCDLADHDGCSAMQLCCDRSDGEGPRCVDAVGSTECTACGMACSSAAAPNCGANHTCECEPGSGKGCDNNQRCMGEGENARCLECETDDDCSAREGRKQCVENKCVQCDRAANEGCSGTTPICGEDNVCVACSANPDDCPGESICNGSLGCLGCSLINPFPNNGCGGTTPVCRPNAQNEGQCVACTRNDECGGGFCDSRPGVGTGECTSACAPAQAPGSNGCSSPRPLCKRTADDFSCQACVPADCTGATPFCATGAGPRQGFCVECRMNSDCTQSGTAPICNTTTGTCRARQPSDCGGNTPIFDQDSQSCVECTSNGHCTRPGEPFCSPQRTCGACNIDSQCTDPEAPVCNTNTHQCVSGCNSDAQCANKPGTTRCDTAAGVCVGCANHSHCTDAAEPLCSMGACVACTMLGAAAGDSACDDKSDGTVCVSMGPGAGRCGPCDPAADQGCGASTPQCVQVSGEALPSCHECDTDGDTGCMPLIEECNATTLTCDPVVVVDAGLPDTGLPIIPLGP